MKLNFKLKKEKVLHYSKIDSKFNIEPSKHWRILFYFGVFVLFMFLLSSWYLFTRFDKDDEIIDSSIDANTVKNFNINGINKTEEFFQKKKESFDILQTTRPIVADPLLYK